MSTAFHPQTDRVSERLIRTIVQILRSMISPDQKDWVEKVPMVEFMINLSVSGSTGFAPSNSCMDICPKWHNLSMEVLQRRRLASKDSSARCGTT